MTSAFQPDGFQPDTFQDGAVAAGGGTPTLAPTLFTNTNTFYTPVVTQPGTAQGGVTPPSGGTNGLTGRRDGHFGGRLSSQRLGGDAYGSQSDTVEVLRARAERRRREEDEIAVIMQVLVSEGLI